MSRNYKIIEIEMPDDDDSDSAMWRAYKEMQKKWRQDRAQKFSAEVRAELEKVLGSKITKYSDHQYGMQLLGSRLDYWPSGSRWRWRNKSERGDLTSFINFIANRIKESANVNPSSPTHS